MAPWPVRAHLRERLGAAMLGGARLLARGSERLHGAPGLDPSRLVSSSGSCDGDPDASAVEAALERLLLACESEAGLDALGRRIVMAECARLLAARRSVCHALSRTDGGTPRPLETPVFVTGLPRSGTTYLHRLLSGVEGFRAPTLAEVMDPAGSLESGDSERRLRRSLRWFRAAVPRIDVLHPVDSRAPEECTFILQQTFRNGFFGVVLRAPSYMTWLLGQDLRPAYEYHRAVLQLLGGDARERWVLKSPTHLLGLPTILEVYPDARIIHLHRDLVEVVGSFSSLLEAFRRLTAPELDPTRIGKDTLLMTKAFAFRGLRGRQRLPADRFLDVDYHDLVSDPLATCTRIWQFLGSEDPTARAHASVSAERERSRPRRPHRYSLSRYGLSDGRVRSELSGYQRRLEELRSADQNGGRRGSSERG